MLWEYICKFFFENNVLNWCITEEILGCFNPDTILLFLGAQDITDLLSQDAHIDVSEFEKLARIALGCTVHQR